MGQEAIVGCDECGQDSCKFSGVTVCGLPLSAVKMEVACFSEKALSPTRLHDDTLGDHSACINRREGVICETLIIDWLELATWNLPSFNISINEPHH